MIIRTDDGSYGEKGSVCQAIIQAMKTTRPEQVFVIGPATTIKVAYAHTTKSNIPTQATLYLDRSNKNSGHGIFKVSACGNAKSICVDGFNFNAWYANFEEMVKRCGREEEMGCKVNSVPEVNIPV